MFWENLKPMLGKLARSTFDKKKEWSLLYHAVFLSGLRCIIVYIDENCHAAIILNNLGIKALVRIWSKNYFFSWQSAEDVHNTTLTRGLYNCQLEKVIACLYGHGKQRKTKIKTHVPASRWYRGNKRVWWDQRQF